MPDLSREEPFYVHQVTTDSGASPRVLDCLPGCQYGMTSYNVSPEYGIHLHDPRLLEYVGAPESARLLSWTPEYWLHHMGREKTLAAALQLQHDAGLILSNIQVLEQFVTSLNRMASEVMWVAFDREPFPSEAVQYVTPSHRVRRAAHRVRRVTWRPWACGVRRALQEYRALYRRRHAMSACHVWTVSRIFRSSGCELFMWCTLADISG